MAATLRGLRWALCFAAGLFFSILSPSRANACSVNSDFLPPSNYELVRLAEQVVLARAVSGTSGDLTFEILETLRGSALRPKDVIKLQGYAGQYAGAGPVDDFSRARPGAATGACVAYDYKLGGQFLLLLRGSASKWSTLWTPFARVNEEVTTPDDPWLAAVRHYARIAALADPAKERAALEALRAAARKSPSPSLPAALAADIERHTQTPSAYKTFAELKAMYDAAPPGRARARALLAISLRGDPAAGPFIAQVLKQALDDPPRSMLLLDPLAHHYEKVPDSRSIQALAELYVKLGTAMKKQARWQLMWTLIRRAGKEHRAIMQKALDGADEEEAGHLGAWFARYPSPEAEARLFTLLKGDYENKTDLTFALAAMGAKAPLDWALGVLKTPSPPQGAGNQAIVVGAKMDTRWVAPYVVARSPLPEADRAAGAIIRARKADFLSLLQGYLEAIHPNVDRRLKEIAAIPDLDADERHWLERAQRARAAAP